MVYRELCRIFAARQGLSLQCYYGCDATMS
jgi:hypothetical protein